MYLTLKQNALYQPDTWWGRATCDTISWHFVKMSSAQASGCGSLLAKCACSHESGITWRRETSLHICSPFSKPHSCCCKSPYSLCRRYFSPLANNWWYLTYHWCSPTGLTTGDNLAGILIHFPLLTFDKVFDNVCSSWVSFFQLWTGYGW